MKLHEGHVSCDSYFIRVIPWSSKQQSEPRSSFAKRRFLLDCELVHRPSTTHSQQTYN